MTLPPPRFVYTQSDQLVYHVGTPSDGSGFILKFDRVSRTFDMYRINFGQRIASSSSASADEKALAVSLLPPEEVARCVAASINR